MRVGFELRDAGVIAVAVDGDGQVRLRADAAGADLKAAALEALARLTLSGQDGVGIASASPESPAMIGAADALAARMPGRARTLLPAGAAAAAAEAWLGAGRGARDVVFFGVDDHASAGIVREGRPVLGANGRAASAGWLALNPVEREDYRRVGCVEAEVAASGIVRRLIWRIKAGDPSDVSDAVGGDLAAVSIDHVVQSARRGDGVSVSVMRDTAKYLGMAAANLVVIADPEVLVLGGIIAAAADLLLDPMRTEIGRRLPAAMMHALAIRTAELGADGPAIGAARLAAPP